MISFNLNLFSKYKSALMGIATILILLTHAPAYDIVLPYNLNVLLSAAQIGVLFFFFLSGLGIYYSLDSKQLLTFSSIISWYKKRLIRLLLPYIVIYGSAHAILCIDNGWGILRYVFDISTISFWFGHSTCWFVNMMIPLYLLSPIWYKLMNKCRLSIIPTIVVFIVFIATGNGYFIQASVFFIGFWIGKYVKAGYTISARCLLLFFLLVLFALALYYFYGIGYLLLNLLFPVLLLCCVGLNIIRNVHLDNFLNFWGQISLESYLFNTTLYIWINSFNLLPEKIYEYRYVFIVILGTILSFCVHKLLKSIISKVN